MKKIITTVFVSVLLISVSCKAQTSEPQMKKHSMQNMQQMLKDSLHLTDVQIDSVTTIRQQSMGTIMAIRNDNSISADQKQEQIKSAKQQMKIRLKSVLSNEQMQQLEEMQRNMHKGKMDKESGK